MFRSKTAALLTGSGLTLAVLAGGMSPAIAAPATAPAHPATTTAPAEDMLSLGELAKFKALVDNVTLVRNSPAQGTGHHYRYTTTTEYWSVVAVDPKSNFNPSLFLFDDKAQNDLLAESKWLNSSTEFIAVDSNVGGRPLGTYFPYVSNSGGNGEYEIQVAQGSKIAGNGTQSVKMTNASTVAVRDTYLEAGELYRFTLTPGGNQMIGSLWLMSSDGGIDPVVPKGDYDNAEVGGPGETVVIEHVASRDAWYGLVVLSEGANGTFQLERETP